MQNIPISSAPLLVSSELFSPVISMQNSSPLEVPIEENMPIFDACDKFLLSLQKQHICDKFGNVSDNQKITKWLLINLNELESFFTEITTIINKSRNMFYRREFRLSLSELFDPIIQLTHQINDISLCGSLAKKMLQPHFAILFKRFFKHLSDDDHHFLDTFLADPIKASDIDLRITASKNISDISDISKTITRTMSAFENYLYQSNTDFEPKLLKYKLVPKKFSDESIFAIVGINSEDMPIDIVCMLPADQMPPDHYSSHGIDDCWLFSIKSFLKISKNKPLTTIYSGSYDIRDALIAHFIKKWSILNPVITYEHWGRWIASSVPVRSFEEGLEKRVVDGLLSIPSKKLFQSRRTSQWMHQFRNLDNEQNDFEIQRNLLIEQKERIALYTTDLDIYLIDVLKNYTIHSNSQIVFERLMKASLSLTKYNQVPDLIIKKIWVSFELEGYLNEKLQPFAGFITEKLTHSDVSFTSLSNLLTTLGWIVWPTSLTYHDVQPVFGPSFLKGSFFPIAIASALKHLRENHDTISELSDICAHLLETLPPSSGQLISPLLPYLKQLNIDEKALSQEIEACLYHKEPFLVYLGALMSLTLYPVYSHLSELTLIALPIFAPCITSKTEQELIITSLTPIAEKYGIDHLLKNYFLGIQQKWFSRLLDPPVNCQGTLIIYRLWKNNSFTIDENDKQPFILKLILALANNHPSLSIKLYEAQALHWPFSTEEQSEIFIQICKSYQKAEARYLKFTLKNSSEWTGLLSLADNLLNEQIIQKHSNDEEKRAYQFIVGLLIEESVPTSFQTVFGRSLFFKCCLAISSFSNSKAIWSLLTKSAHAAQPKTLEILHTTNQLIHQKILKQNEIDKGEWIKFCTALTTQLNIIDDKDLCAFLTLQNVPLTFHEKNNPFRTYSIFTKINRSLLDLKFDQLFEQPSSITEDKKQALLNEIVSFFKTAEPRFPLMAQQKLINFFNRLYQTYTIDFNDDCIVFFVWINQIQWAGQYYQELSTINTAFPIHLLYAFISKVDSSPIDILNIDKAISLINKNNLPYTPKMINCCLEQGKGDALFSILTQSPSWLIEQEQFQSALLTFLDAQLFPLSPTSINRYLLCPHFQIHKELKEPFIKTAHLNYLYYTNVDVSLELYTISQLILRYFPISDNSWEMFWKCLWQHQTTKQLDKKSLDLVSLDATWNTFEKHFFLKTKHEQSPQLLSAFTYGVCFLTTTNMPQIDALINKMDDIRQAFFLPPIVSEQSLESSKLLCKTLFSIFQKKLFNTFEVPIIADKAVEMVLKQRENYILEPLFQNFLEWSCTCDLNEYTKQLEFIITCSNFEIDSFVIDQVLEHKNILENHPLAVFESLERLRHNLANASLQILLIPNSTQQKTDFRIIFMNMVQQTLHFYLENNYPFQNESLFLFIKSFFHDNHKQPSFRELYFPKLLLKILFLFSPNPLLSEQKKLGFINIQLDLIIEMLKSEYIELIDYEYDNRNKKIVNLKLPIQNLEQLKFTLMDFLKKTATDAFIFKNEPSFTSSNSYQIMKKLFSLTDNLFFFFQLTSDERTDCQSTLISTIIEKNYHVFKFHDEDISSIESMLFKFIHKKLSTYPIVLNLIIRNNKKKLRSDQSHWMSQEPVIRLLFSIAEQIIKDIDVRTDLSEDGAILNFQWIIYEIVHLYNPLCISSDCRTQLASILNMAVTKSNFHFDNLILYQCHYYLISETPSSSYPAFNQFRELTIKYYQSAKVLELDKIKISHLRLLDNVVNRLIEDCDLNRLRYAIFLINFMKHLNLTGSYFDFSTNTKSVVNKLFEIDFNNLESIPTNKELIKLIESKKHVSLNPSKSQQSKEKEIIDFITNKYFEKSKQPQFFIQSFDYLQTFFLSFLWIIVDQSVNQKANSQSIKIVQDPYERFKVLLAKFIYLQADSNKLSDKFNVVLQYLVEILAIFPLKSFSKNEMKIRSITKFIESLGMSIKNKNSQYKIILRLLLDKQFISHHQLSNKDVKDYLEHPESFLQASLSAENRLYICLLKCRYNSPLQIAVIQEIVQLIEKTPPPSASLIHEITQMVLSFGDEINSARSKNSGRNLQLLFSFIKIAYKCKWLDCTACANAFFARDTNSIEKTLHSLESIKRWQQIILHLDSGRMAMIHDNCSEKLSDQRKITPFSIQFLNLLYNPSVPFVPLFESEKPSFCPISYLFENLSETLNLPQKREVLKEVTTYLVTHDEYDLKITSNPYFESAINAFASINTSNLYDNFFSTIILSVIWKPINDPEALKIELISLLEITKTIIIPQAIEPFLSDLLPFYISNVLNGLSCQMCDDKIYPLIQQLIKASLRLKWISVDSHLFDRLFSQSIKASIQHNPLNISRNINHLSEILVLSLVIDTFSKLNAFKIQNEMPSLITFQETDCTRIAYITIYEGIQKYSSSTHKPNLIATGLMISQTLGKISSYFTALQAIHQNAIRLSFCFLTKALDICCTLPNTNSLEQTEITSFLDNIKHVSKITAVDNHHCSDLKSFLLYYAHEAALVKNKILQTEMFHFIFHYIPTTYIDDINPNDPFDESLPINQIFNLAYTHLVFEETQENFDQLIKHLVVLLYSQKKSHVKHYDLLILYVLEKIETVRQKSIRNSNISMKEESLTEHFLHYHYQSELLLETEKEEVTKELINLIQLAINLMLKNQLRFNDKNKLYFDIHKLIASFIFIYRLYQPEMPSHPLYFTYSKQSTELYVQHLPQTESKILTIFHEIFKLETRYKDEIQLLTESDIEQDLYSLSKIFDSYLPIKESFHIGSTNPLFNDYICDRMAFFLNYLQPYCNQVFQQGLLNECMELFLIVVDHALSYQKNSQGKTNFQIYKTLIDNYFLNNTKCEIKIIIQLLNLKIAATSNQTETGDVTIEKFNLVINDLLIAIIKDEFHPLISYSNLVDNLFCTASMFNKSSELRIATIWNSRLQQIIFHDEILLQSLKDIKDNINRLYIESELKINFLTANF